MAGGVVGDCAGAFTFAAGSCVRIDGVVAAAIGEVVTLLLELYLNLAEFAVPRGVGWRVGEGVEVGAAIDGRGDGLAEAVGVDEGAAPSLLGHLLHGGVFGKSLLGELVSGP